MKKAIGQGLAIILLFFSTLLILQQVDWIGIFKVEKATKKTEEKLGELIWDTFNKTETENTDEFIVNSIDSIVSRICTENNIERSDLKIHIINEDDINAFALPNGHLMINSGLILNSKNQEELSGVICHEIAHIELNHVMHKLINEIGLAVLISMTTNKGGTEIMLETVKLLSSTAFDRNFEKEADLKAVDYLINARIDPEPFANFLYKLADKDDDSMKYLSWISTHPDSKARAEYVIEYSNNKTIINEVILSDETWNKLLEKLDE